MSFVEGNLSVGIELAPGTLERLKNNLANIERGINLKVNVDSSTVDNVGKSVGGVKNQFSQLASSGRSSFDTVINKAQAATSTIVNLGNQIAKGATFALAGLALEAIHAGIAFNTLQQKTTGALKSILGSTEQAKALLAQVNTFVNTSPFGRDTFLQATQTLVGFGVEAQKVVPILGAVQNAVGGIGGSDQDILQIAQGFAEVASAGKLTGDVIFSLQQKGIDAAGIIATQFGTTASAIRDQVSAGTITADKAFTALIDGLNKKFPDAAANVKNTFTGVVQRMNAAIRDIGANLTAAFINPEGGGGAVEGVNNIASALRNIQSNVIPALLPLTKTLADGFLKISQAFLAFTKNIDLSQVKGLVSSFAPLAPLLAGVGGALTKVASDIPLIGNLIPTFDPLVGILVAVLVKSQEFRDAIVSLVSAAAPLVAQILPPLVSILDNLENVIGRVAATLIADMVPGVKILLGAIRDVVSILAPLVGLLSGPVATAIEALGPALKILGDAAALAALGFVAFNLQLKAAAAIEFLTGAIEALGVGLVLIVQRTGAAAAGLLGFGEAAATTAAVEGEAAIATDALAASSTGLLAMLNPVTLGIVGLIGVYQILKPATLDAEGASKDLTQALEHEGNAANTATAALVAHEVSAKKAQSALKAAGIDTGDFAAAMIRVGKAGGPVVDNQDEMVKKLNDLSAAGGSAGKAADKLLVDLGNFAFDFEKSSAEANAFNSALASQKAATEAAAAALSGTTKVSEKLSQSITTAADNFDKMRSATDALKSSQKSLADLLTVTGQQLTDKITTASIGLTEALQQQAAFADKAAAAHVALGAAQRGVTQAQDALNIATTKRNQLLADTGRGAREVADAEAALARTGAELINQDEQRIDLQRDLARTAADTPDKLAAGDRSIERAKIALNQATREEINLQHQIDATKLTNVDLAGLSVDQIRTKLANTRASLDASKRIDQLQTNTLAEQETTAHLNTLDAAQALKDSVQSRSDIELALGKKKREDEEALQALQIDHESSLRRQTEQQNALSILRSGDTQAARDLKALNIEIANDTDAITTSVGTLHGAEQDVKNLLIDQQTLAIDIRNKEREVEQAKRDQKQHYIDIKNAQQKVKEDAQKVSELTATTLGDHIKINEALVSRLTLNSALLNQNPALVKNFVDQILGPQAFGPFVPGSQAEKDANNRTQKGNQLSDILLNHPDQLLTFLKGIGLKLAEGAVIHKETFATIGEAGREVVLPLTRPARLAELLAHRDVLPPVLAALAHIRLPSPAGATTSPQLDTVVHNAKFTGVSSSSVQGNVITGDHWEQDVLNELRGIKDEIARIEGGSPINIEVKETNQDVLPRKIRREIEKMISERRR